MNPEEAAATNFDDKQVQLEWQIQCQFRPCVYLVFGIAIFECAHVNVFGKLFFINGIALRLVKANQKEARPSTVTTTAFNLIRKLLFCKRVLKRAPTGHSGYCHATIQFGDSGR